MGLDTYIEGQTPLDEDEKKDLLLKTISTRHELDRFEQNNIEKAIEWTYKKSFATKKILSFEFITELHKRMFSDVWRWAGRFRKTDKNIGVDKFLISTELHNLLEDCKYWFRENIFPDDEFAIRMKHRLVKIHLFPNGNGRHSRLYADVIISKIFSKSIFSWGNADLSIRGNPRKKYLRALYKADKENYKPLIRFARS